MLRLTGITPACAGNRRNHHSRRRRRGDHPRLRGEQLLLRQEYIQMEGSPPLARGTEYARAQGAGREGSPPLARGTVRAHYAVLPHRGITPACAGNRIRIGCAARTPWDHPRLRGEQPSPAANSAWLSGSPPLARGTVIVYVLIKVTIRITPACAGNRVNEAESMKNS